MKGERGSITLFLTLLLVPMLSLILALLDLGRVQGLESKADMSAALAADSLAAAYSRPLWEEYGLLFYDGSYGSGDLDIGKVAERLCEENRYNLGQVDGVPGNGGSNFYRLGVRQADIPWYELATDQNGAVFRHAVLRAYTDNLAGKLLEQAQHIINQSAQNMEHETDPKTKIHNGQNNLEEARQRQEEQQVRQEEAQNATDSEQLQPQTLHKVERTEERRQREEAEKEYKNTLKESVEILQDMASGGELTLFTGGKSVSQTACNISDGLQRRRKNQGTMQNNYNTTLLQRALFDLYLQEKFSCYTNKVNNHATKYELEYIIAGKDSDQENLRSVIHRLFFLREASNFIYRNTDRKTREKADAVAATLALWFPISVPIVRESIIAAYSVKDSVDDVKSLLNGKRVKIYKVSIGMDNNRNLGKDSKEISCMENNKVDLKKSDVEREEKMQSDKTSDFGLTYLDYLHIFLLAEAEGTVNYRTMDLMEWSIQSQEGYENFRMDNMISQMKGNILYQAPLIFSIFGAPDGTDGWEFQSPFYMRYEKIS